MPLSFRPFSCVAATVGFVDEKNSRSACSGRGVGVSKINVSTMEPFDDPKDTLKEEEEILFDYSLENQRNLVKNLNQLAYEHRQEMA